MTAISDAFVDDLFAITLFVESLDVSEHFYGEKLGLNKVFSDDVSAVYKVGSTLLNLLWIEKSGELIAPLKASAGATAAVYTLRVKDVDAMVKSLDDRGVTLLNGPQDMSWGVRTASFADPDNHVWELADHSK